MPIFGYVCSKCGEEFEVWEPCKEEGDSPYCPKCGIKIIRRMGYEVTNVGLDLKTGKCVKCGLTIPGEWT